MDSKIDLIFGRINIVAFKVKLEIEKKEMKTGQAKTSFMEKYLTKWRCHGVKKVIDR